MKYTLLHLNHRPELLDRLALLYREREDYPALLASMEEAVRTRMLLPRWYLLLEGERIAAALAVLQREEPDAPCICAVHTEPEYRRLSGRLIQYAIDDLNAAHVPVRFLLEDRRRARSGWQPVGKQDGQTLYMQK